MDDNKSILNHHANVRLIASAGTGKTFNLSLRTICILLSGTPPESVLCLTFTRKATAEMEERIMRILSLLAAGRISDPLGNSIETEADTIAETLGMSREELFDRAAAVYPKLLADLSRLSIRTIDSFVNLVLTLFPFEANLRPDFTVGAEDDMDEIATEAFGLAIGDIRATESGKAALNALTGTLGINPMAVRKYFEEAAKVFDGVMLEAAPVIARLAGGGWGRVTELAEQAADADAEALAAGHRMAVILDGAAKNKNHAKAVDNLLNAATIERLMNVAPFKEGAPQSGWLKGVDYPAAAMEAYAEACAAISRSAACRGAMYERAGALFALSVRLRSDELKRMHGVLGFSDLTERAWRLLVEGSLAAEPEYLYFRLDGRITHILVDEFQDTSVLQWQIMKPLADEAMAGLGTDDTAGSFFFVGDPKQTLYRFRGGMRELFDVVEASFAGKMQTHHLSTNFRSSRQVVSFVDTVFKRLAADRPGIDYTPQSAHREHEGYVKTMPADSPAERLDMAATAVFEARSAGYRFSDIAILVNTNAEARSVAEKLGSDNVPVVMESSRKLSTAPAVRALVAAMAFAVHGDDYDLVHFLASTPAEINLDQLSGDLVERFRQRHHDMAAIARTAGGGLALATRIAHAAGITARFSDDANLGRAFDVAAGAISDIDNPRLALAEFARALGRTNRAPGGFEDAVIVMTIHKSKGLEFPVVIAPLLNDRLGVDAATSRLIVHRTPGTAEITDIRYNPSKGVLKWLDEAAHEAVAVENERAVTDGLNRLYVCLTRARDALFVATTTKEPSPDAPPTPESFIIDAVGAGYETGKGNPAPDTRTTETPPAPPERPLIKPEPLPPRPDIEAAPEPENFHAETFGRALHEAVYLMNEFTDAEAERAAKRAAVMHGAFLGERDEKRIIDDVTRLVNFERFTHLVSKGRVYREQRFMHEGRQFVIDLFVVTDDVVHLVDFKTGHLDEDKLEMYTTQLTLYAEILRMRFSRSVEAELAVFDGGELRFLPVDVERGNEADGVPGS